jgi:pyruvate formate lyase activating enzyme
MEIQDARFWESLSSNKVRCNLCRFHCVIANGRRGRCGVRENRAGVLYTLVYGKSISEQVDPIEKKPLYHFYPGSRALSMATVGCNFRCLHCQNSDISQWPHEQEGFPGTPLSPAEIVADAQNHQCVSIAYTYTEPTIYYEYAYDTAVLASEAGIKNIFVTNGYTTTAALEKIAPFLDAANVDLKGFSEEFYREVTGASLAGVLDCLKDYRRLGIWLEVTTLVIPGLNDSDDDLRGIAQFIAGELGRDVPWHVTAFYPTYRMLDRPPTPLASLVKAREAGVAAGLDYVYVGNVAGGEGEFTFCPGCGAAVIRRQGFRLLEVALDAGLCRQCGHELAGVGLGTPAG